MDSPGMCEHRFCSQTKTRGDRNCTACFSLANIFNQSTNKSFGAKLQSEVTGGFTQVRIGNLINQSATSFAISIPPLLEDCSEQRSYLCKIYFVFISFLCGGFCPGDFWQGGFCPGGFCPGGFVQGFFVLIPQNYDPSAGFWSEIYTHPQVFWPEKLTHSGHTSLIWPNMGVPPGVGRST